MSAYALPGLFPPIESSSDNYETGFSDATSYFGRVAEPCESSYSDDLVPSPLHHQIDGSRLSGIVTASLDLLSVPSFTSRRNGIEEDKQVYLDTDGTFFGAKKPSNAPNCAETSSLNSDDHGIAVKEAKIDPVRLIHSLTGWPRASSSKQGAPQHQHSQRKTLRKRGSRERLSDVASPQSSPGTWKSTIASPKDSFPSAPGMKVEPQNEDDADERYAADSTSSVSTPHDEAIEFELAIAFNGRKYTATRTLQRIVQLRDDLIREMNNRKRWLRIRRSSAAVAKAATNSTCSSMDDEEECLEHDAPTVEDTLDESQKEGDDDDITIPEIPAIITCDGGTGADGASFMGRGFTMIQAMAKSYVPLVERWLRNIMVIVPQDSECLTNFLWEPISTSEFPGLDAMVEPFATKKSSNNLAALGSIKELDYNTGDDDSDLEPDDDASHQAPADCW